VLTATSFLHYGRSRAVHLFEFPANHQNQTQGSDPAWRISYFLMTPDGAVQEAQLGCGGA
jgi:hypothetical protein